VNSLARRTGYTSVNGFETYILGEAKTEDAERVAQMENEAIRFEQSTSEASSSGLDFILKDLQINEHLRESARVAELMQQHVSEVHSGADKGVKQGNFMVLNTAQRPAVLFEMGYSTNRGDARMMTEPSAQRRLARAIAGAILTYLAEYERRSDAGSAGGPSGS
jgi:N-acetylmuramoyl-L-alanine amidase